MSDVRLGVKHHIAGFIIDGYTIVVHYVIYMLEVRTKLSIT